MPMMFYRFLVLRFAKGIYAYNALQNLMLIVYVCVIKLILRLLYNVILI